MGWMMVADIESKQQHSPLTPPLRPVASDNPLLSHPLAQMGQPAPGSPLDNENVRLEWRCVHESRTKICYWQGCRSQSQL